MKNAFTEDHPIINACLNGDIQTVRQCFDDGIHPNDHGLIIACVISGGSTDIANLCFEYGFDPNKTFNDLGETPLMRAIEKKKIQIVKLFLARGANVHARAMGGGTPLHAAAGVWPEAISILLQAGADIHAKSTQGRTALHVASHGNQLASLEFLVSAGADIEAKDAKGTTPLISAAKGGKLEAAKWLLEHGADINAEDERGKTALDWAKANKHAKVVELLQQRMGS